jgi:hypothetical protein
MTVWTIQVNLLIILSESPRQCRALYETACTTNNSSSSYGLGAAIPDYLSISFTGGQNSVENACLTKDSSYFEQDKKNFVYSFLPKEAFDFLSLACAGGLVFTGTLKGDQINLRARYADVNGSGNLATLDSDINISPPSAVMCGNVAFKKGLTIIPGGREQSCTRLTNTDIQFTISTDVGTRTVWLTREPQIEYMNYVWSYNLSGDSQNIQCKFLDSQGTYVTMGDFESGGMGGYGPAAVERVKGFCVSQYGIGYYTIDGKKTSLIPQWTYSNPQGSLIDCFADGKLVPGGEVSCLDYNTCSAVGEDPGRVRTNMNYWCAGHFYHSIQSAGP